MGRVTLSAAEWNPIADPRRLAHGFLTLEPDTEVSISQRGLFAVSRRAIRFDDPAIGIDWPLAAPDLILSDRDREAPLLATIETGF